jgi:predicted restriction endonuclease
MKLVNFASLDPAITGSGRKGLGKVSKLDREIWDTFHADWEKLTLECEELRQQLQKLHGQSDNAQTTSFQQPEGDDYSGETRDYVARCRIKQEFFRRAVFSNYRGRCCMSGLSESRLLVASHIVPWSVDRANRLNPRNGLCLSAIHDKAFDNGLITISDDLRVILSGEIRRRNDKFISTVFFPIADKHIECPERFTPSPEFLEFHRNNVFLGQESG